MFQIGDQAPDFNLMSDGGKDVSLSDYKGGKVILYFYPKDNTSGCTTQACDFRDQHPEFLKMKTSILGVSRDSLKSHTGFRDKYALNFPLLSDESGEICQAYGVWVEKSMYGKKYFGIERSTFLINESGTISHIWRKVKIPGHITDVLKTLSK